MRMRLPVAVFAVAFTVLPGHAEGPAAVFKTESELMAKLTAAAANPDMLTSPVSIEGRHRINIVRRTKGAGD